MKKIINTMTTVILVMLFCLIGCNLEPEANNISSGMGQVQLQLTAGSGRTLLPVYAFDKFELTFTPEEGQNDGDPIVYTEENDTDLESSYDLEIGEWTISLNILNDDGNVIATGSTSVTVLEKDSVSAIIDLEFIDFDGEDGTIVFDLEDFEDSINDVSEGYYIALFMEPLFGENGETIVKNLLTDYPETTYNIPAGYYLSTIKMGFGGLIAENQGFVQQVWSDVVHIYPNQTTIVPKLTNDDFAAFSGINDIWIKTSSSVRKMQPTSAWVFSVELNTEVDGNEFNFKFSETLETALIIPYLVNSIDKDGGKFAYEILSYGETSDSLVWTLEENGVYTIIIDLNDDGGLIVEFHDVSDLERIVVEGETLVHYYPTMEISPGPTHSNWNGEENPDGSFTITAGGIRYSFDAITDAEYDLDDYDFVAVHYTASDVNSVVYKHFATGDDYNLFSGSITDGTGSYQLALSAATSNGFTIQKWQAGTGATTIKINKLVFTQGDRGTLTLNSDGGNINATHAFVVGLPLDLPTPNKDGKVFTGWHDGSSIIAVTAVATVEMKNITLTAQWDDPISAPMVIVDFKATGSTTNTTVTGVQNTGGSVVYTGGPAPETTGFEFTHAQGWGNDWVKFTVTLPDSVTLFAYDRITFDITYISGDLTYKTMSIAAGAPITFTGQAQGIPAESVVATRSTGGPTAGQIESLDLALNKTVTTGITGQNIEFGIAIPAAASGGTLGGATKFAISNFRLLQEDIIIIEPTPVEDIAISPKPANILVGATQQLTATIEPDDATNKNVTWESSDLDIATITGTGLTVTLNAISVGTATITVISAENPEITDSFTITVDPIPVEGISITPKPASILSEATLNITATVSPSEATNKAVTWSVEPADVVTLSKTDATSGEQITVTALATTTIKTAVITVTSDEDPEITDSFTITVNPIAVTGVSLDHSVLNIAVGEESERILTATIEPGNAANKTVTWISSDPDIATVTPNSDGLSATVRGIAEGEVTITVKTTDGEYEAECKVTVMSYQEGKGYVEITLETPSDKGQNFIVTADVEDLEIFKTGADGEETFDEITFTLTNPPDSPFTWYVNGQAKGTDATLTIKASELPPTGSYSVFISVKESEYLSWSSSTLTFSIYAGKGN